MNTELKKLRYSLKKRIYQGKKLSGSRSRENGFTLIELIMVVVIISILSVIAIPMYTGLSLAAKDKVASGVCGALNSSIMSMHGNYLMNEIPYSVNDIIGNTIFTGGVTTANFTVPAANEINFNYKGETYILNYIPQNGDSAANIECGGSSDDGGDDIVVIDDDGGVDDGGSKDKDGGSKG